MIASGLIDYAYNATAGTGNTTSNTTLTGVFGASSAPGFVQVNQAAGGTVSTLNIDGNGFTMGQTLGLGAHVNQASTGATSNVTVKAAAIGYTVSISQ